jgi:hypothetical protein
MSANIKASVDGTQAIIGVGGVDQMTVSNAGVVTANSFVGAISGNVSSATALATGSTTARTLANRFADAANVKDFGAIGDGIVNDIAAFVAASDTGKQVLVPDGTYTITVSNQTQATSIMAMMVRLHLFCNTLTVNFLAGTYTFPTQTDFLVTNGEKLIITGATPTDLTYSSLGTITSTGVGDHSVTINVTDASSVNINDFITFKPTDAITDSVGVFGGIWKVTNKVANSLTFKNTAQVASIVSATITGGVTIKKINTILNYNASIGFYIRTQLGAKASNTNGFKDLAIIGDNSGSSSGAGVYLEYGASVNLSGEFGVNNFAGSGIYGIYQGLLNATGVCVSNCGSSGVYALNGSTFQTVRMQSTGNGNYGFVASVNSNIAGSQSNGSGNNSGYGSLDNSAIICNYAIAKYNANYGFTCRSNSFIDANSGKAGNNLYGIHAFQGSYVDGTGATISSNTTYNYQEEDGTCYINGAVLPTKSRAEKVHNFATISAQTVATTTISVPGVDIGDVVALGWNGADVSGLVLTARASATDTITIYAANITGGSITVGNRTYWVRVFIK